ncbi:glycoside hydrolase family 5 protein [Actinospica robiniae]|uniref:glycoside hydrolase family 5 protein n=1 Tax=Actinospica robiniae TaxID=304901 RepID=UPI0004038EB9|nr:cellulase family glycosylhydrolase [Actinospica robiniae]
METSDDQVGCAVGRAAAGAAAATSAAGLAALTLGLGYLDGTGLFAPENWPDAGVVPGSAGSPAWATLVYLPLLIIGSTFALYRTLRSARSGVRARWVLGAAWSGLVLTAFGAKVAYTLLLLAIAGTHDLQKAETARALLAECGLTGAKYALFGVFAAAPAALVYRIVARRAIATARAAGAARSETEVTLKPPRVGWSAGWLLVGAPAAVAAADGSFGWIGGRWSTLILPLGGLAGSWAVLRRLRAPVARGLADDRTGGATWWVKCATLTAASALGFLAAFVVDGVVNGFGGGLYPIVGALMYVAVGAVAGVCASVAATAWALARPVVPSASAKRLAGRWAEVSRPARLSITACAAASAIGLGLLPTALVDTPAAFPLPSAASADGGGLLALTVLRADGEAPVIADSAGRQVLLRGVNVNQLVDYGQPDPSEPTVRPLTDADYAEMAGVYGFDVQRLNLSWSRLEPSRGVFDQAYIASVRTAVDQAAAHGVYTVLDMHQDTYSKYVTAASGTTCRIGATPEFGNDGAPAWATLTDGAKACGFQGRDLSPNVEQSFTDLYDDTDGIGAQLADTWGVLARAFAGDSAVAGYDLLNEPGPGNAPGVTSALLLGRLYQQIITEIRAGEGSAADGFHHLVFFEPSILWSGLGFDVTPPAGFSSDPDLVFSPHLYSQSITMDQGLGVTLTTIEQGFTTAERTAAAYDVPLWSGEWGWFGDQAQDSGRFDTFLDTQNANLLGSAIWVWKKACGDPQTGRSDQSSGGLNPVACPAGTELPASATETVALSQAYPRSAPGRLNTLTSSATGVDLRLAGSGSGTLDVWIPGSASARPAVAVHGLTGLALAAQPGGGWRLTAQAAGAYDLTATA